MNIILGSASPRRNAILRSIINSFTVLPPGIEEKWKTGEDPAGFARRIAEEKCRSIMSAYDITDYPALVITSDTIVTIDGIILGKPADFDDAMRILSILNGRTHRVITALTLLHLPDDGSGETVVTDHETTAVRFKKLQWGQLAEYLYSIDYMDKAGSYAFQEQGGKIIESYRGSVTNIIGFPLRLFFPLCRRCGVIDCLFNGEEAVHPGN